MTRDPLPQLVTDLIGLGIGLEANGTLRFTLPEREPWRSNAGRVLKANLADLRARRATVVRIWAAVAAGAAAEVCAGCAQGMIPTASIAAGCGWHGCQGG